MNNNDKVSRIVKLREAIRQWGGSPKRTIRLQVSMAAQEIEALMKTLPGSVRRGLARGRLV